jgi:hypothetical protein
MSVVKVGSSADPRAVLRAARLPSNRAVSVVDDLRMFSENTATDTVF